MSRRVRLASLAKHYAGEINAALCCLLILALGFLWMCRNPSEAPVAEAPNLLHFVEIANSFHALPTVARSSRYSLDAVERNGAIVTVAGTKPLSLDVSRHEPLVLVGWALDSHAKAAAAGVYVTLDATQRFAALYGGARPDVATNTGYSNAPNSGFAAAIPENVLVPGRHRIFVDIVNAGRTAVYRQSTVLTLHVLP